LIEAHTAANAAATVVTAWSSGPTATAVSCGWTARSPASWKSATRSPAERQLREINSGIYAFDLAPLFDALRGIASQNAQGEFYLTDLVSIYRRRKLPVETLVVENPQEIRGINSRTELAEVSRLVRQNKNEELMAAGVTLVDPATTYVDPRPRSAPTR
jgi:bifunctional UDP-N-acetylglucosamine pyrophosphorylase/glucosamine-1-phosphate N-acetyltransferase